MKNKIHAVNILLVSIIFLASCNLPSSQAGESLSLTAAAQTIQALISATPGLPVPTSTPIGGVTLTPFPTLAVVTNTPAASPTTNCNVAQFVADVTIPDGTIMTPGQAFVKKWRLRNIGSCTWTGFNMTFDSGDSMGGPASKPVSTISPGQEVDLDVNLTAPSTPGNYRGYWRIITNGGVLVPVVNGYQGRSFYVDIRVQGPATATNTSVVAFAVTSVTLTSGGSCGAFIANADITTNSAGSVTYHWVRSDGATDGVSHPAVVFASAGTQSVNTTWSVSASGTHWIDIYIDSPNHQQFGRATFTCP
jgi:hypothetical protein